MSKWHYAVMLTVVGLLAGGLAMTRITGATAPNVQRAQELSGTVTRLEQENEVLIERVGALNEQIRRYEDTAHDSREMEEEIAGALKLARMEAGLTPLTGPGIVVEVDDLRIEATGQIIRPVQDEDLLAIVNELNAAGAEAISINGERLISISEIRLAGNHININTRAQSAPYTLQAVGNPDTLLAAMNLHGGVVDTFSQIAAVRAYSSEALEIPAYRGVLAYQWARVAE